MITFSQLVTEDLGSPAPWKWKPERTGAYGSVIVVAEFNAGASLTYEVTFRPQNRPIEPDLPWTLWFNLSEEGIGELANDKGVDFEEIDPFGILNLSSGQANVVISTVAAIVKDFIPKMSPQSIVFGGSGRGRQAVYRRLMRYVEREIPGYRGITSGSTFKIVKV